MTALGARDLELTRRRPFVAAAAFFMQLALGAVYGWSVFLEPLQSQFDASRTAANLTFTITLAALGIAAGFGGCLQFRIGPRVTGTIAGILYGTGVFLSGLAPNLTVLYLTHGVIGGIGIGLGYIVPLAVLVRWFPDRLGFITGLAVTGFGLGALATSPLATELIRLWGVRTTLMALGAAYLVIVVTAAQFLPSAPENFVPAGYRPPTKQPLNPGHDVTLYEALHTPQWYILWAMLALNVSAGAALISVASPLVQEFASVGALFGAIAVCVISLFNGLGRLFWGSLSDRIGRARTFLALFILQAATFAALNTADDFRLLLFPVAIIALCYGGGFGTMPAFTADTFGAKYAGTIYGVMLTAWSVGACVGPLLIAAIPYRTALPLIALMLAVSVLLPPLFEAVARRNGLASVRAEP